MWDTFWKTIIYGLFVIMLTTCTGCALMALMSGDDEPVRMPCDQVSMDLQILAARKAGCKRYKIEKDEQFKICTFICYESN